MNKVKSYVLNKEVYLLGITPDRQKAWLKAPSWDCEHYWGFGYVEIFTDNTYDPKGAKDIYSHQHIDSSILGENKAKDGGYCYNPYNSIFFTETAFSEAEGWELGELFKSFYILKATAEYFQLGSAHISIAKLPNRRDVKIEKHINEKLIPEITSRIIKILTPVSA